MEPLISICTPIYGVEKYIERCARSLFEQTYSHIEYIFVDDCGKDNSVAILESVCQDYPEKTEQIHIVHHSQNRGLAAARNTAVEQAHGEFIIHVDSDDWVEKTMVEVLVKKQMETNADIVSANAIAHYSGYTREMNEPEYATKEDMIKGLLKLSFDHVVWRRLIRTSLYKDHGVQAVEGANIGEDHQVMPQLAYYAQRFATCDEYIYHYNCENINSYVHDSGKKVFNQKKYASDNKSLDILTLFFQSKQESIYIEELRRIKAMHIYQAFFPALRFGEKNVYNNLCIELLELDDNQHAYLGLSPWHLGLLTRHYYLNRMRALARATLRKITGIAKLDL